MKNYLHTATMYVVILGIFSSSAIAQIAPTEVSCQNNGSIFLATDDYISFTLNPVAPSPFYESTYDYTLTATQGASAITILQSNGSPASNIKFGYPVPFRTPNGTAGKGNITLTITPYGGNNTTTITLTDPGSCALSKSNCTPGEKTITSTFRSPLQTTEAVSAPALIPQFQETEFEVLTKVDVNASAHLIQTTYFECTTLTPSGTYEYTTGSDGYFSFDGGYASPLVTTALSYTSPSVPVLPAVLVPATGTWPGDATYGSGSNVSTILAMQNESWFNNSILAGLNPTLDPKWVTARTGVNTNDDDMYLDFFRTSNDTKSASYLVSNPSDLSTINNFKGTGSVPLKYSTLSNYQLSGGGGNLVAGQATQTYFTVDVTYTYNQKCTIPLPVKLKSFNVKQSEQKLVFDWAVVEEINVNNYEVEQSSDAKSFYVLTSVKASNRDSYEAIKENMPSGHYYFRLKAIDLDGTYAYSRIIDATVVGGESVKVFPSPASEKITVATNEVLDIAEIDMIDSRGVSVNKISNTDINKEISIQDLTNGLYIVNIKLKNGQVITKKILIAK